MGMDYEINGIRVETYSGEREDTFKMLESYAKKLKYKNEYASTNYDNVVLRIRRDGCGKGVLEGVTREGIKAAAANAGMCMSEYILQRACEAMQQRGEVLGVPATNREFSKNEIFLVRGDLAAELIARAKDLDEDPRDIVLKAVRDYYTHKINERETENHLQQPKDIK